MCVCAFKFISRDLVYLPVVKRLLVCDKAPQNPTKNMLYSTALWVGIHADLASSPWMDTNIL